MKEAVRWPLAVSLLLAGAANAGEPGLLDASGVAPLRLAAPFEQLMDERDASYAALISTGDTVLGARIEARGRSSLSKCRFPKLLVDLPKKRSRGTVFEGLDPLRINTHCQRYSEVATDFGTERVPFREALLFRLWAEISTISLRARPARITYLDMVTGTELVREAALIEHSEVAARRLGLDHVTRPKQGFDSVEAEIAWISRFDPDDLAAIFLFNAMILNSDWVIRYLHNLVGFDDGRLIRLAPYDFDYSEVVTGAAGGIPDEELVARIEGMLDVATLPLSIHKKDEDTGKTNWSSMDSPVNMDGLRNAFETLRGRRDRLEDLVASASIDTGGRAQLQRSMEIFFEVTATFLAPDPSGDRQQ